MKHVENWIWLPQKEYQNEQTTYFSRFVENAETRYTVAEFVRKYEFPKKILQAELRFSGDAVFQLFCNGEIVGTGPACVGGDFIGNDRVRDNFYAFEKTVCPDCHELDFFARVQLTPYHICEYSKGHGGLMLSAILTFEDGTKQVICTDESWLVRKNGAYVAPRNFDGRIPADGYVPAELMPNIWNCITAPIPVRDEADGIENGEIILTPEEEKTVIFELDKIWGGFIQVESRGQGVVSVDLTCREIAEETEPERLIFLGEQNYRGFCLHSAGNLYVVAKNHSSMEASLAVSFIKTYYPIYEEAVTATSDSELDAVLETCKHTLKICRQTHHLDSTRHCEPMACTGDYYIESLMTPFSFGDMRLAEFDLVRTAIMLERENGRMFHTTYSLIWVRMLHDVYMLTGNLEMLEQCRRALELLLARFDTYMGEEGLLDNPPDYMFVDWIYIDGFSMHHPPKSLGQSCLNLFYFGALDSTEKIYQILGDRESANRCRAKREDLRKAINKLLFDRERGCYFEGINDPAVVRSEWDIVTKRYYLKHSNILACYFGVCSDEVGRDLIDRIMKDEIEGDYQPYFMHYLLEAVYRLGLREKYTVQICERWKASVRECSKGLTEGFVTPEPGYGFDHSHAWGGTPLYSLPKALMGLEIQEAGMKSLTLSPSLLGLEQARAELLTPYGKVVCEMKAGEKCRVTYPDEISVRIVEEN